MKKSLLTMLILSANLLTLGCADDQARAQIADLNNRLSQMQDSVSTVNSKLSGQKTLDVVNKMGDMQDQIDQINGSISTLNSNQKKFQDTQNQVNQSLQQQITSVSGGVAAGSAAVADSSSKSQASGVSKDASAPVASSDDDKKKLKDAFNDIKAHKFKQATSELKEIITSSDNPATVSTANYYLAVAYAASGQYKNSIVAARKYLEANPNGRDAANAMRTIYISESQLGLKKSAQKTANELIKKFPNSDAAKKVKAQIS